jgi:hypothetical protein
MADAWTAPAAAARAPFDGGAGRAVAGLRCIAASAATDSTATAAAIIADGLRVCRHSKRGDRRAAQETDRKTIVHRHPPYP